MVASMEACSSSVDASGRIFGWGAPHPVSADRSRPAVIHLPTRPSRAVIIWSYKVINQMAGKSLNAPPFSYSATAMTIGTFFRAPNIKRDGVEAPIAKIDGIDRC